MMDVQMNTGSVPNNLPLKFQWRNGTDQTIEAEYSYMKVSKFVMNLATDIEPQDENSFVITFDYSIITPETLSRIIEWCRKYNESPYNTQEDAQKPALFTLDTNIQKPSVALEQDIETFMKMDHETLLTTLLGANYLHIQPLIDVGCKAIARTISGKSAEEIRKLYNIHNDFTPEEEEQIRRENAWAEDR